jgi:uncharacterized protein (DUF3084 family)
MYGLVLIAVLAVTGGAIAYIGDKLGTKVGKRKLTIFGLRPKHTSILVTIVTGILIASSTIGVMALISRDVRTALFGMEALKAELSTLSQDVSAKNVELDESRTALEAKTVEYSTLNAKVKETADQLASITTELTAVTVERDHTAAALQRVQSDYVLARGDLTKAKQEIHTLQVTKAELDTRVAGLNEAKVNLQTDVDRLNELTNNLKQNVQVAREGAIIFRANEVLSTAVIEGGQPVGETEKALTGAIYHTNQSIIDKLDIEDKNLDVLWIAKADFDQAVSLLTANPESIAVRISTGGNTIYGEPVIGRIELFPNKLIYSKGTVVHSDTIKAGKNNHQAEESVIDFLQKVNANAIKQGILPDPIQGTVGVMSGSQLYDTVNKVERYGGQVKISAIAKDDVHTVGPLQIEIKVERIE